MKNYALLDENNLVINISIADDNWDSTGWIEYTELKPASIGYSYNPDEDIFIAPQPYPSWIRSGSFWNAPTPMPTEGKWYWDEPTLTWIESTL
jgi:hypothetical protein